SERPGRDPEQRQPHQIAPRRHRRFGKRAHGSFTANQVMIATHATVHRLTRTQLSRIHRPRTRCSSPSSVMPAAMRLLYGKMNFTVSAVESRTAASTTAGAATDQDDRSHTIMTAAAAIITVVM